VSTIPLHLLQPPRCLNEILHPEINAIIPFVVQRWALAVHVSPQTNNAYLAFDRMTAAALHNSVSMSTALQSCDSAASRRLLHALSLPTMHVRKFESQHQVFKPIDGQRLLPSRFSECRRRTLYRLELIARWFRILSGPPQVVSSRPSSQHYDSTSAPKLSSVQTHRRFCGCRTAENVHSRACSNATRWSKKARDAHQ
jgi:hypothetical protein